MEISCASEDVDDVSRISDPFTIESFGDIVTGGSLATSRIFDMPGLILLKQR